MFHVWFGRVSGGVDVFLALSGFFFGGRLLRTALTPGASLWPVPEVTRLVRRLLPALVVVLAASAVLTILIQPETRWETFADQSLASLGYYQNWELANTASDYLRAGEAVSPLQHIWSMSVQGQFYIAFLALIFGFAVAVPPGLRPPHADRVHRAAQRADHRVVRLRDLRPQRRPGHRVLQQLRAGLGAAARRAGRRAGASSALADVAAHDGRRCRAGRDPVACGALIDGVQGVPRPVGAGAGRRDDAVHPVRRPTGVADPHTGGRMPAPNRLLATTPFVRARRDGVLAVPVALAAADLLAGLHRTAARQLRSRAPACCWSPACWPG